jgi:tyrosyl-tRNA synthetase
LAELSASDLLQGKIGVVKLLVALGLAKSNNEARRLVQGGGVTVGPEKQKITDPNELVTVTDNLIVRVGSKRVVRVQITRGA